MIKLYTAIIFFLISSIASAAPVISYSDLSNGPATGGQGGTDGAFVTISGRGFGNTQDTSYVTCGGVQAGAYLVWSDSKISFQVDGTAATGAQTITVSTSEGTSNSLPFYVNSTGDSVEIYFCDVINGDDTEGNGSYSTPWKTPDPWLDATPDGQILYVRSGTYSSKYGSPVGAKKQIYTSNVSGTANAHNIMSGYPGETVIFQWTLGRHFDLDGIAGARSSYWTLANIVMDGNDAQVMGGVDTNGSNAQHGEETGGHDVRIVNCTFRESNPPNAAMSALVTFSGDDCVLYGSAFYNNYAAIGGGDYNNIHMVYIRVGADNVDIGWNNFYDNHCGWQIQVHTDHNDRYQNQYDDVLIHHNHIQSGASAGDARGVTVSNVGTIDSTIYIYENFFDGNSGNGDGTAFAQYRGTVYLYNNTFYQWGGDGSMAFYCSNAKHLYMRNNLYDSAGVPHIIGGNGGCSSGDSDINDIDVCANNLFYNGTGSLPSGATGSQTDNPLLNDPSSDDIGLQSGSAAINNGTSDVSSVVLTDYTGKSWTGIYEIGAAMFTAYVSAPTNLRVE